MIKLKIEKSNFPEGEKTHILVKYNIKENSINIGRIFKGSYSECLNKRRELYAKKMELQV